MKQFWSTIHRLGWQTLFGGEGWGQGGGATTPPRHGLIGWPTMSDGEGWAWGGGGDMKAGVGGRCQSTKYKSDSTFLKNKSCVSVTCWVEGRGILYVESRRSSFYLLLILLTELRLMSCLEDLPLSCPPSLWPDPCYCLYWDWCLVYRTFHCPTLPLFCLIFPILRLMSCLADVPLCCPPQSALVLPIASDADPQFYCLPSQDQASQL